MGSQNGREMDKQSHEYAETGHGAVRAYNRRTWSRGQGREDVQEMHISSLDVKDE